MTTRKTLIDSFKYIVNDADPVRILAFDNRDPRQSLYGRVDASGRAIAPLNKTAIEQIPGTDVSALCYVVDAFVDLQAKYERLENPINGLPILHAKKGYVNPLELYDIQLEFLFTAIYANYILPNKKLIKGMGDFVNFVLQGLLQFSKQTPITYSGFVKSRLCPMHASGLVIDLLDVSHGASTLEVKRKILNSPSFPAFTEMLISTGFVLLKHAPWCLVARNTGKMYNYSSEYDSDGFHYHCRGYDLDKLKGKIREYYELLYFAEGEDVAYNVCHDGTIKKKRHSVARSDVDDAMSSFYSKDWYRFYVNVRAIEENIYIPESKLDRHFEICYSLLIKHGIERSLDYLERKILNIKTDYYI